MVLVLCLGDLHVPHRAADLPPAFKELLQPGKVHRVLCTGNLCAEAPLDFLRSICADVTVARGDADEPPLAAHAPPAAALAVGGLRIGVVHGHDVVPWGDRAALAARARRLGVDVLVAGHARGVEVAQHDGRLLVCPGSATGAPGAAGPRGAPPPPPSFVLMDVDAAEPRATLYVYELVDGELRVDKVEYARGDAAAA